MNSTMTDMQGEAARWLSLADEEATLQFAATLARALPADEQPLVLYLHGDLGAGKTTLARGMLHAMGERGAVRSPTYGLIAEYQPQGRRVMHLDLYRLNDPDELHALGLADHLPGSSLWLIEWPDKGEGGGLPAADAHVDLEPQGTARRVRIRPASARGAAWARASGADSA
jgi:tRNA threonylcarbamoyladenosine biosynthesis protein TsaE